MHLEKKITGIAKPCTQFHPAPSTPTQLILASTQLFTTTPTLLEPEYRMQLGNFLKFRPKNSNLSVLIKNWHRWYLGGADSRFRLRFLKFRPQNWFLAKFGRKKSKLPVLPENWHTWYLERADSKSRVRFSKFRHQKPFLGKYGTKQNSQFILI